MVYSANEGANLITLRFLRLSLELFLVAKRWLLVLPVVGLVSYGMIRWMMGNDFEKETAVNSWDGIFVVLGNANVVFYCLTLLYLYIVTTVWFDLSVTELVVLRLGGRRVWWWSHVAVLGLVTGVYLGLVVGTVGITAVSLLPWQNGWSKTAVLSPDQIYLPSILIHTPPLLVLGQLLLLLFMGCFALGSIVLLSNQLLHRLQWGFILGCIINFSSLVAHRAELPAPFSTLFINYHLLFPYHAFSSMPSPYPSFNQSLWYWSIWIGAATLVGLHQSQKHPFLKSS